MRSLVKSPIKTTDISTHGFYCIFFLGMILITSCTNVEKEAHQHNDEEFYTCPMHPTVVQDKPGSCPICGMDLVPVNRDEAAKSHVMLSDNQMKLANISVKKVSKKPFGQSSTINGRLAVDKEGSEVISSRIGGRIEHLAVKETGGMIKAGTPLYTIYSEDLLILQQEYLLAKEQHDAFGASEARYKSFLDASTNKLLLYGLTRSQIRDLKKESIRPFVTFASPASGMVTEINIAEGQYVKEGDVMYKLEKMDKLWVEAELYPQEIYLVKPGDVIGVRVDGQATSPIEAKVTFLSPEIRASSQVIILRAEINNPDLKFKPGQQVSINIRHSEGESLTVPADAVIRSEQGAHVYLLSGKNTFVPRIVKIGNENADEVEIIEGIKEGDSIAASGAYLIYSEFILKKGGDPTAGHPANHGGN
jgi:membrane fusion protein, copper/silver efflux system